MEEMKVRRCRHFVAAIFWGQPFNYLFFFFPLFFLFFLFCRSRIGHRHIIHHRQTITTAAWSTVTMAPAAAAACTRFRLVLLSVPGSRDGQQTHSLYTKYPPPLAWSLEKQLLRRRADAKLVRPL